MSIVYGPVPSRRLGRSTGINNIPPKVCSYSCVYCQLGPTRRMQTEPAAFYEPVQVATEVREKIEQAALRHEQIDYLTFVPDGEPTLDINLGDEIDRIAVHGIKIAVITNGSLVFRPDVRERLQKADWVCLKVDAVTPAIWRQIDRPHKDLKLEPILDGLGSFARTFEGTLATETMLVKGLNDDERQIEKIAAFLAQLRPDKAYITIPTRPPAKRTVTAADEHTITMAYQIFNEKLPAVECVVGYEGNAFALTGVVEDDLLAITAVHPMTEEAVDHFLKKAGADWDVVHNLVRSGALAELTYRDKKFYARRPLRPGVIVG